VGRTPAAKPRVLLSVSTSVTGTRLTVEEIDGVRTLYLEGVCQSDILVDSAGMLSVAQPLELVQVMSLLSLGWLAGGTAHSPGAPHLLLIGLGGGSIARLLSTALPHAARLHCVELEPEVIQAAVDFFGLVLSEPHCTAEAGDSPKFLRTQHKRLREVESEGGDASAFRYDVLMIDAFNPDGLCESTTEPSTLDDACGCLAAQGLLLMNLHTGDTDDPDYWVARRVLRALCQRFDSVYQMCCVTTQNLIAVCHNGDFVDAAACEARLAAQLEGSDVAAACSDFSLERTMSRFELVGGKDQPMSDDDEDAPH